MPRSKFLRLIPEGNESNYSRLMAFKILGRKTGDHLFAPAQTDCVSHRAKKNENTKNLSYIIDVA